MKQNYWQIWRIPIALAMLTVLGLMLALVGHPSWHWITWLALAVPIAMGLWHALRRRD